MLIRILTSGWFAALVLAIAGFGLYMLHSTGQTLEAIAGGVLLFLAMILIMRGGKKKRFDDDFPN
jgi:hypothetical protein